MKIAVYILLLTAHTFFYGDRLNAQDSLINKVMTIPDEIQLALKHSVQLKVVEKNIELAKQQIEIDKLYRLPGISSGIDYGYISNADIWNPSFSDHQKGSIPHHYTQFSVQAGEVVFKGGAINNSLGKATLEEQVAVLTLEKNTEGIKFLIGTEYLDIFRFINLKQVYVNNAILASHRLQNILVMQKQGMVTENDVLRTRLILSDLQLTIRKN